MHYLINIILLTSLACIVLAKTSTITLGYVPLRPFYAPYPIRYPQPAIWPKISTPAETYAPAGTTTIKSNFPLDSLSNAINEIDKLIAILPEELLLNPTQNTAELVPDNVTEVPKGEQNYVETTTMKETTVKPDLVTEEIQLIMGEIATETEANKVSVPNAILNQFDNDNKDISTVSPIIEYPTTISQSDLLSNTINEINKLVANLPEDLLPIALILQKNKTELVLQEEPQLFTSPNIITKAPIDQNSVETTTIKLNQIVNLISKENRITIGEDMTEKPEITSISNAIENSSPILNDLTATKTPEVASEKHLVPLLDVRSKFPNKNPSQLKVIDPDAIVFPDEWFPYEFVKPASTNQELTLIDKFGQPETSTIINKETTTKVDKTTPIILGYVPTRPFYAPNPIFYPQPSITSKPNDLTTSVDYSTTTEIPILVDKFGDTTNNKPTTETNKNTPIVLGYVPTRPFYAPNPIFYPQPSITSKPNDLTTGIDYSTTTEKTILVDKFGDTTNNKPTTEANKNTPIVLGYVPTRPFYAPNPIFYPQPSITSKPNDLTTGVDSTTTSEKTILVDKFGDTTNNNPTTEANKNTPIVLGYVPTRPFYAPNPIFYPQPSITSKPNDALTTNVDPSTTTQKITLIDKFGESTIRPTTYNTNTQIILGYRPIRPFYAPNPIFYPQPFITSKTIKDATTNTIYPSSTATITLIDKLGEAGTNSKIPLESIALQVTPPVSLEYIPNRPDPIRNHEPSIPVETINNTNENDKTVSLAHLDDISTPNIENVSIV